MPPPLFCVLFYHLPAFSSTLQYLSTDFRIGIEEKKRIQNNLNEVLSVSVHITYISGCMLLSNHWSSSLQLKRESSCTVLSSLSQNQSPFPEQDLTSDDIQQANIKWLEFFKNHSSDTFGIQLSSLAGCGECRHGSLSWDPTWMVSLVYLQWSARLFLRNLIMWQMH